MIERIRNLPKWAAVAFSVRNALRVLPMLAPNPSVGRDQQAQALRTAAAACSVAIHIANNAGGTYLDMGRRVADGFQAIKGAVPGPAHGCILQALHAAIASTPWRARPPIAFNSYREAASAHGAEVVSLLDDMAAADLAMFEQLHGGDAGTDGTKISIELLARPLYDREQRVVPRILEPMVSSWLGLLSELEAHDVLIWWKNIFDGDPYRQDSLVVAIDSWLDAYGSTIAPEKEESKASQQQPPMTEHPAQQWDEAPFQSDKLAFASSPPRPPPPSEAPAKVQAPAPTQAPTPTATPSAREPKPPDGWMLSDRPLEDRFKDQDRFQFIDYANALATILDHPNTDTPFTMAINAPWGAGKTTLANMIADELVQRPKDRGRKSHIICRFNAWMHDDAPNLATAFISEVSRTADKHRPMWWRVLNPLPAALLEPSQRVVRRMIVAAAVMLVTGVATWWIGTHLLHVDAQTKHKSEQTVVLQVTESTTTDASGQATRTRSEARNESRPAPIKSALPPVDAMDSALGWFQSWMGKVAAFITALAGLIGAYLKFPGALSGFVESPDKAAVSGTIQLARGRLKRLIDQATARGNRFVVFVDDIERCKPPRSLDVLDAVNQLLDHRGVMVVLLGDMAAVAATAQLRYKELSEIYVPGSGIGSGNKGAGKEAFGRLYLQKIIQFQFDLPIPPKQKIQSYMTGLVRSAAPS